MSIGLADSMNPSTIGPALYLAAGERPRETVAKFTLGVFLAYLIGGLLIALGAGQLVLSLVPTPSHLLRQVLEVVAGVAMLAAGLLLWQHRHDLSRREPPAPKVDGHSSTLLGAGITVVELPTAFPYFFVIAAIVASPFGVLQQVLLIVLFNFCFVLPLLAIVVTLWVFGDQATEKLARARVFLQRRWPILLAVLAVVAGLFVIALGATAIAGRLHGKVGRLFRHVNKILH